MPNLNATFTVAGITTDSRNLSKVRWTTDLTRRVKLFLKDGYTRVDLVDLPKPMTKLEALQYLGTLPQFDNPADRATIAEATAYRELVKSKVEGTYVPRPRGRPRKHPVTEVSVVKTRKSAKKTFSLDKIAARAASVSE